jgi:hypothetical protein
MTDHTAQILTALKNKPGAIAVEIGATPVDMIRLEKMDPPLVQRVGKRRTGSRGRPPVEWAVTGVPYISQDEAEPEVAEAGVVLNAEQKRMIAYIDAEIAKFASGARQEFGDGSNDESMLRNRRKAIIRAAKRV